MRILITSGPTREYVDDVRFLSNASSGKMGFAIAEAAIEAGHEVVLISGPVTLKPPAGCEIHAIETTEEMHTECLRAFPKCDGVIGAAAVCDYRPRERFRGKRTKSGEPLVLELIETVDILADLGRQKGNRWIVGFALESQSARSNALRKLAAKNCDAIVLNATEAIGSETNHVELINQSGETAAMWDAPKKEIARNLIAWISANMRGDP
jgi:phosphopantothenoylcysteine decarboxylase/phosphopantothenate--cysteine ligase